MPEQKVAIPDEWVDVALLTHAFIRWESVGIQRQQAERALEAVLPKVRERLLAEAAKLERPNIEGGDLTSATLRAVKAQGIRDAFAAAFPQDVSDPDQKGR